MNMNMTLTLGEMLITGIQIRVPINVNGVEVTKIEKTIELDEPITVDNFMKNTKKAEKWL